MISKIKKKENKMEKEDPRSKENVVRRFAEIEKDASLDERTRLHKKDVVMLETYLEIRDLLKNLNSKK